MSTFMDRAKGAAKQAADMAKQGAEQAKERGAELTLRRKFNGLAEELGQIVFRQKEGEGGLEAEVDRLVAEMRGVQAEMDGMDAD